MRMYFFDVTLKVMNQGVPEKVVVYKAARAFNELSARRTILNHLLVQGFQVVRIDRVEEQSYQAEMD